MNILIPNKVLRRVIRGNTDSNAVPVNKIIYKTNGGTAQLRVCPVVSNLVYDRSVSVIVKGTKIAKSITFPGTIKGVCAGAFDEKQHLKSVVLNEGLERLEGGDDRSGGVFSGTRITKVILPSTLRTLG